MATQRNDTLIRVAGAACCLVFALTLAELLPLPDALPRTLGRPILALLLGGFSVAGLVNPRLSPRLLPYLSSGYALLAAASLALSVMAPSHGLLASYHAEAGFAGPAQLSTDASSDVKKAGASRIDPAIRFSGIRYEGGDRPFPLSFFDSYHLHRDVSAGRIDLPFSASWEGVLHAHNGTSLVLEWTPGDTATLSLDGVEAGGQEGRAELPLKGEGPKALRVSYDAAKAEKARLRLSWVRDGVTDVVPESALSVQGEPGLALQDQTAGKIALMLGAGFLGFCLAAAPALRHWRPGLLFLAALALGMAKLASLFLLEGKAVMLNRNDGDEFVYLSYARDILLTWTDPEPVFYFNIFLRHVVALAQGLLGEGIQSVIALNWLFLALTAGMACSLAGRILRDQAAAARVGLLAFLLVALNGNLIWWVEAGAKDASLSGFLYIALAWAALEAVQRRSLAAYALGGLLLGLNCLTRGNALLLFGLLPPLLLLHLGWREGAKASLVLAGCALLTIAPATVHNVLGGKFALLASNSGINIWLGNNPAATGEYNVTGVPDAGGDYLRATWEFITTQTDAWLHVMWLKVRYMALSQMGGWTAAFLAACVLAARRLRQSRALVVYMVVAVPFATCLIMFASKRYLFPVLPLMCCVMAPALDVLLGRFGWRLPLLRRWYPKPPPRPAKPAVAPPAPAEAAREAEEQTAGGDGAAEKPGDG